MTARSATRLLPVGGGSPREVSLAVNLAIKGKLNSAGSVTLAAGVTSTTVFNPLVTKASAIFFAAQTANAAAIAMPYVTVANITEGDHFVITHANDANADKVFSYCLIG